MEKFSPKFSSAEKILAIDDIEEARDFISAAIEKGERPIVTVPKKYAGALQSGLTPHASWIPDIIIISGTLGRKPYLPESEERVAVKIKDISADQVHPRLTGPDKKFHGVIVLDGPIPPDALEVL